jgi:hypothetical protein
MRKQQNRTLDPMKTKFHPTLTYTKETGLVIVLILLLWAYWKDNLFFVLLAIGTLLVVITVPVVLKPLALIWYYASTALGNITNRIVLTIIYWGVLTPVGMVRRWLGFDPMKRKVWKNGTYSVFTERNHIFKSDDLNMPY